MKKLNAEWHRNNRMPKSPTFDQRLAWHIEHQKNCSCREMPSIRAELERRVSGPPEPTEGKWD
jgi:hypothetical protein